jgi:hypothetical protein
MLLQLPVSDVIAGLDDNPSLEMDFQTARIVSLVRLLLSKPGPPSQIKVKYVINARIFIPFATVARLQERENRTWWGKIN